MPGVGGRRQAKGTDIRCLTAAAALPRRKLEVGDNGDTVLHRACTRARAPCALAGRCDISDHEEMGGRVRRVYLDRSAWAELVRDEDRGGEAISRLRRAVRSRKVGIALSEAVVDETFPVLLKSVEDGKRHLSLLLEFADWKKGIVRRPKDLIRQQATAALKGERIPPSFGSSYETRTVVRQLPDLMRKNPSLVAREAARIEKQKSDFEAGIDELRSEMLLAKANVTGRPPKLADAIDRNASFCIRSILKQLGFEPLSDAEVEAVLRAPAPRMYAAVHVAYVLFQVVQQLAPHHGDGYDLLHAVSATATGEFVSCDKRLRDLVQAAGGGSPVVSDLATFIESVI